MSTRPKILILTARTGGGHLSLADALRDLLEPDYAVTIADMLPAFFHHHYRFVGHHALWMWTIEFHASNRPRSAKEYQRLLSALIANKLKRVLDEVQPQLVITTHSLLSYSVKRIMQRHAPAIPFVMLFSDPESVHATWFSEPCADASFAPTRESHQLALAAGFDPQRLYLTGWPVRGQFYHADVVNRQEFLSSLGLDPLRYTIFLQGGGDGATNYWRAAEHLLVDHTEIQIILSVGTHTGLPRRFRGVQHLHVLPYTDEIAPYMAASDVVMGKAGPNVLFESVILGKPFIATTHFPGQERGNLAFIGRYGLGYVALEYAQQLAVIQALSKAESGADDTSQRKKSEYRDWNREANKVIGPVIASLLSD